MVTDFIDALGGNKIVAASLNLRSSAISNWRAFNAIPPEYALDFQSLCKERGVVFDAALFKRLKREER